MNQTQLNRMHLSPGFIAALDQSGGSTPKALKNYGIFEDAYSNEEEMYRIVHEMRTRMIKSKAFNKERIIGAILFENTMDRKIDGLYTADYLYQVKGIVPFLKIDKGLMDVNLNGAMMLKPIPNLDDLLLRAKTRNIFGTKMRSVIKKADPIGVKEIVDQQFDIAKQVASFDLVPIIEPEVDINITDKKEAEDLLLKELEKHLAELDSNIKVIFKLTLPEIPNLYLHLSKDPHVVRVVALSGGYTQEEANRRLRLNKDMVASFSRALSEGLKYSLTDQEFETKIGKAIDDIYDASINK